jgi:hypothetical protein
MPVTITFYKLSEKKPEHLEDIIWLRKTSCFNMQGFEPREIQAEYQWTALDEDGTPNGNAYCYEGGEDIKDFQNPDSVQLDILFDGYIATDDFLWVSQEEYWKCFEEDMGDEQTKTN